MGQRRIYGALIGADDVGKEMLSCAIRKVQASVGLAEYTPGKLPRVYSHCSVWWFSFCTERFDYRGFEYAHCQDDILKGILNVPTIEANTPDLCVFVVDARQGVTDFQRRAAPILAAAAIPIAAIVLTKCDGQGDELIALAAEEQRAFWGDREIPTIAASPLTALKETAPESALQPINALIAAIDRVAATVPEPQPRPLPVPEAKGPSKPRMTRMTKNAPPPEPKLTTGRAIEAMIYLPTVYEAHGKQVRLGDIGGSLMRFVVPDTKGSREEVLISVTHLLPKGQECYQGGEFGRVRLVLHSYPGEVKIEIGLRFRLIDGGLPRAWGIVTALTSEQEELWTSL